MRPSPRRSWPEPASALALAVSLLGCSGSRVRDPHEAAASFARAAAQGDAGVLYAMLSPAGKRALSVADVVRLTADEKGELSAEGRALTSPDARVRVTARLRYDDGEEVALDASGGPFTVTSGGTMPGGAPTPEAALDELRRAIARRSYPALLRLLSPALRSAVEQDLRTLVTGLERPDALLIHTTGDASSAVVPGGHHVSMKREGGIWRVEDFD